MTTPEEGRENERRHDGGGFHRGGLGSSAVLSTSEAIRRPASTRVQANRFAASRANIGRARGNSTQ
jgi:hypothetical protein